MEVKKIQKIIKRKMEKIILIMKMKKMKLGEDIIKINSFSNKYIK